MAGVLVALRSEELLRNEVAELFEACAPVESGHAQVIIDRRAEPIVPPEAEPTVITDDAAYWFADSGVFARHHDGVCGGRFGSVVRVGGIASGADASRAFRLATQMPFAHALSGWDREVVHAAAVERDSTAMLIAGLSGAGKSTFTYAAHRAGWNVISDDLTVLSRSAPVVAWGFPKPLHVPGDILDSVPVGATEIPGDLRGRWKVAPPRNSPGGVAVRGIVTVDRSEGGAAWRSRRGDTSWAKELLVSFPLARTPQRLRASLPIAAALARLPAFEFLHDRAPTHRPDAVARFLDWAADEIARQ